MQNLKKKNKPQAHRHREQIGCQSQEVKGRVDEMGEGNQKAQVSSYKIDKSWDLMTAIVSNLILHI